MKYKRNINKIAIIIALILCLTTTVLAHGGNVSGWKDKDSDKIIKHNGKYYGYHKQNGEKHYHEVKWNEEESKWEITKTAVCYDEDLNLINTENTKSEKVTVKLQDTVDGDTAKVTMNNEKVTVRFLGIDTPETVHPEKEVEPYGPEASNFTKETLKNATKIELEFDNNADKQDKYNRYLAWIWVDGELLQEKIIKKGFAKTYMLQDNYKYAGRLQEAEEEAKENKLGIWSDDSDNNKNSEVTNSIEDNKTEETKNTINNNSNNEDSKNIIIGIIGVILIICMRILKSITMKRKN